MKEPVQKQTITKAEKGEIKSWRLRQKLYIWIYIYYILYTYGNIYMEGERERHRDRDTERLASLWCGCRPEALVYPNG